MNAICVLKRKTLFFLKKKKDFMRKKKEKTIFNTLFLKFHKFGK